MGKREKLHHPAPDDALSSTHGDAKRRERFRALYELQYPRILGYALRRAPADESADVVAETFLVAWRRLSDVPEGDDARLWLYGTARRVLANRARSERRRDRLTIRLLQERPAPTRSEEPRHETGAVAAAFHALRPDERELLALVAWEGLDANEVARVLGCSPNAVRIRLHRARRKLARALALSEAPGDLPDVSLRRAV
jgi:RNA polymerase sigma-70 factor (ECF subfamily)